MILTLEVTGPQSDALGHARRKVFGIDGGTIGRLPDNTWVLAEPYVSGRHAIIRFIDGSFQIEDTSTNGVFLNSTTERIVRGRPYPIKSGDRIVIDPYEIVAHVDATDPAEKSNRHSDPFEENRHSDPFETFGEPTPDPFVPSDPLQALNLEGERAAPHAPSGSELSGGSPLWAHYTPPKIEPVQSPELIPSNWQDSSTSLPAATSAQPAPVRSAVKPEKRPAPAPQESSSLSALLESAGINEGSLTPEIARDLGQIFRIIITGVMDVLKVRQQTKDQFGLGMTTFKKIDNNPLKFSADVEEALQRLFVRRPNAAYLGPVDAFEDAFEDMRNHQIAMLVGVRVAFEAMLSEFDPDHLQEQFDRTKKAALVSIPARLRYWDLYRDWIHDMVRDADTSFRELFGDEFARAYEEQLKKLKAQGRAAKG
ncbi:MAG TPA: type VI secretion system-associated FHA domain protein TagH [Vicinamibacterales bacterium]|nr:type VI secretion system-associated FHA domain protein TagH [Vicinamibacterales bacterium]